MSEDGLLDEIMKNTIGATYLKIEQSKYFEESSIFIIKFPVSEHCHTEVINAKTKKVHNLQDNETFEEEEDKGQRTSVKRKLENVNGSGSKVRHQRASIDIRASFL